jgi:hypothetical protein
MKLKELINLIDSVKDEDIRFLMDGDIVVEYRLAVDNPSDEYKYFDDFTVNSITKSECYIDIDLKSKDYVEIWHTEDGDDWAQVSVNKATGKVVDIQACGWTCCSTMPYDKAVEFLKEEGFTDFDPGWDRYENWWEFDEQCGIPYAHL